MSIINELNAGELGVDNLRKPPTRLALTAARYISQLENTIGGLERANFTLTALNNQLQEALNAADHALRESRRKTSPVETGNGEDRLPGSDQPSKEGTQPENGSSSSGAP